MLAAIVGCDNGEKPFKAADSRVLKTQLASFEQAGQVEKVVQDAAEQQWQKIDEEAQ